MLRFTLRETALIIIAASLAMGWWLDRWQAASTARDYHEASHRLLIDGLKAELQRVADETGQTIRVQSPGITVTASPTAKHE